MKTRYELAQDWSDKNNQALSADEIMGVWDRHPEFGPGGAYYGDDMQCICNDNRDVCTCCTCVKGKSRTDPLTIAWYVVFVALVVGFGIFLSLSHP